MFRDAARHDLRTVLDEAIDRLPEKYRAPIVLCYLEGKTNEEAAAVLGCPTGTVVTRLARARDRLRARLGRRGVGVTASVLVAALSDLAAGAAATLPDAVAKTAAVFVLSRAATGPVPARAAVLTEGALRAMSTHRLKVVAGVLAALCLAGVGPGLLALRAATTDPAGRAPAAELQPVGAGDPQDPAARPIEAGQAGADAQGKDRPKDGPGREARSKVEEVVNKSFTTGKAPSVALDLFNGTIEIVADADHGRRPPDQAVRGRDKELAEDGLKNIQLDLTQDKDTIR